MTSRTDQQTARVNVDDATWRDFRILALDLDRSIADYLGQLVRDELRRARRRNREESARTPERSDGDLPPWRRPGGRRRPSGSRRPNS